MGTLEQEKHFHLTDPISGESFNLTSKELHDKILGNPSCDYYWPVPVSEIMRALTDSEFSKEYSIPIKLAILDSYIRLEDHFIRTKDKYAVWNCFNSLNGNYTEPVVAIRKNFLCGMLRTASHISPLETPFNPAYIKKPIYESLLEKWIMSKLDISQKHTDLETLMNSLHSDFIRFILIAESEGKFEKDE